MKFNRIVLFVSVIFFLVSGNFFSANATLIDFETLYDGTEPNQSIWPDVAINEYQALGVTFSGGGLTDGTPLFGSWERLNESIADRPPSSNKFYIRTDKKAASSEKFDLNIFFDSGVHAVSGDVIYNPNGTTITVNAYGEFDDLLDSMIMPSGQSTWIGGRFSFISSSPIFWIHLEPSNFSTSTGLDNLLFDPVPEPATILLFGLGLLSLAGVGRRTK